AGDCDRSPGYQEHPRIPVIAESEFDEASMVFAII
ncbi:MAG: hypothetical protein ACI9OD_004019, partial [Limisphaerales bacterium]